MEKPINLSAFQPINLSTFQPMKNRTLLIVTGLIFLNISCRNNSDLFVRGVSQPVISLNGIWDVCLSPYDTILKSDDSSLKWYKAGVPGECMMQGIPVMHDKPFVYMTRFLVPEDFRGKLVKLRFEGVYSYSRVWVNGTYIRDHHGGFTAWECEITRAVNPGEEAVLHVEVTDRADEISYASGYAKHQIGGILRNVSLLSLPENHPESVIITTDLDETYNNAILKLEGSISLTGKDSGISLELRDPDNRIIKLDKPYFKISGKDFIITNLIKKPLKWEAEHPVLYRLTIEYSEKGKVEWRRNFMIGFREVKVDGNRLLVNGRPVKLRGACRHDIHPVSGRMTTPEYDLKDVLLAKEANMNFIRTSHYPPCEKFLQLCDRYGLYVEEETAVCFVGSHRTSDYYPGSTENSDDFTGRYLSQLQEMVNNHRNHPSVIIWSIGNENQFGSNFKKSYDWVKENDHSRPIIFSYPGLVPDSIKSYDIISMHYPGITGDMDQYGMKINGFGHEKLPVLFDEWAHVPCYNIETVREDPNIRDFWGMSLDSMWQKTYDSDGGLGGAIWGMIDETFMLPADLPGFNQWWGKIDKNVIPGKFAGPTVGYGEWGIVDTWRRRKPEFWSVKKAYSPVRLLKTSGYEFFPGDTIEIPVYNRHDFTGLEELEMKLTLNGKSQIINLPDIAPHSKGNIPLRIDEKPLDDAIFVEFIGRDGNLVDSYKLTGQVIPVSADRKTVTGKPAIEENDNEYLIKCNNLVIGVSKSAGLLSHFVNNSGTRKLEGPFMNIRLMTKSGHNQKDSIINQCQDWKLSSLDVKETGNDVLIIAVGAYRTGIKTVFKVLIGCNGEMQIGYTAQGLPEGLLREVGIGFGTDSKNFDSLYWNRDTYWPAYPEDHLSAPVGSVPLFTSGNNTYRTIPVKDWQYDKKSFFYDGVDNEANHQLVNIARSTKENIREYCLRSGTGTEIQVHGDHQKSCRIMLSGNSLQLFVSDLVDYPDISWGNYSRNYQISGKYTGQASLTMR